MATVAANAKEIEDLKIRVSHIERVVILGDGDRLPLAEIVRNLTKTVTSYIEQKDKEEQLKKEEWRKLKWVIVGFAVPTSIIFFGQAFVFFFRIYPILAKLAE